MATKGKGAKAAQEAAAAVTHIKFLGYADDVPEEDRVLTADEVYEVIEEDDQAENPGGYIVRAANPSFDSKKKESDKNPKNIEVPVFAEEMEPADAPQEAAAEAAAPVAVKGGTKVKGGKAPAAPKVKEAKVKAEKAPKAEAAPKTDEDSLPELTEDEEDADVLQLVSDNEGVEALIGVVQELEGDIATSEYRMGGILYHIKKDGGWRDLHPEYKERGGFQKFLLDNMNVDYRKGMYLIEIYVTFSKLKLENPAEAVARIGWTKASKIVPELEKDAGKVDDLLKLAEESTVADLTAAIKEQNVSVGGKKEGGEVKTRVSMKFRLWEEEGLEVKDAITAVKDQQGFQSEEEALVYIVRQFVTTFGEQAEAADAPTQTAPVGRARGKSAPATADKAAAKPAAAKARSASASA